MTTATSSPTTRTVNLASRRERANTVKSLIGEANSRGNTSKLMSNALTSSFKYANQELRDAFYEALNTNGQSISSVINSFIVQYLADNGVEVALPPNPVRYGRPLGSRNVQTKSKYQPAPGAKLVDGLLSTAPAATRSTKQPPLPTIEDIALFIMDEGNLGLYPVGEYRYLDPQELTQLKREVMQGTHPREILTAKFIDELGNYFDANWGWWFNKTFILNLGGVPARLVINAIVDGKWLPTDPEDVRVPASLRKELFDEAGNPIPNPTITTPRFNFEHFVD